MHGKDGQVAEDGWIDYQDNINEIDQKEEIERHKERFNLEALR